MAPSSQLPPDQAEEKTCTNLRVTAYLTTPLSEGVRGGWGERLLRTDTRHDEELDFLSQEPREGTDELYIQKDSMLAITHKYPPAADEGEAKKQTL